MAPNLLRFRRADTGRPSLFRPKNVTMSKLERLLEEFKALPPHLQSCVLDARSRWAELYAAAIYADRFEVEIEMPERTNEKAVDFLANGKRIQHKFMTKRGFIKLRADHADLVDEIMATVDLGHGHRFFVMPMEAIRACGEAIWPILESEVRLAGG